MLKDENFVWKRVKKSLASKRDKKLFKKAQKEIKKLEKLNDKGEIELFYFDESGFSLDPNIPYRWQKKGTENTIKVPASKSSHINLIGLMTPDSQFKSVLIEGSVNTETLIHCLERLFKHKRKDKKYVIILDNSPLHSSELFQEQMFEWGKRNIYFYFLPPYSPELNKIEKLWNFIKYQWLEIQAYNSKDDLWSSLIEVLCGIGKKYRITFA